MEGQAELRCNCHEGPNDQPGPREIHGKAGPIANHRTRKQSRGFSLAPARGGGADREGGCGSEVSLRRHLGREIEHTLTEFARRAFRHDCRLLKCRQDKAGGYNLALADGRSCRRLFVDPELMALRKVAGEATGLSRKKILSSTH